MSRRVPAENFFSAVRGCPRLCARTNPWFRGQTLLVLGHGGGGYPKAQKYHEQPQSHCRGLTSVSSSVGDKWGRLLRSGYGRDDSLFPCGRAHSVLLGCHPPAAHPRVLHRDPRALEGRPAVRPPRHREDDAGQGGGHLCQHHLLQLLCVVARVEVSWRE